MMMITRGGIVPGGLIAEALDIKYILTAAVRFSEMNLPGAKLAAWPEFLQFPDEHLLEGRRTLVVDVPLGKEVLRVGAEVTDKTKLTAAGKAVSLDRLKAGDRVRIEFRRVATGDEAIAVEALRSERD